MILFWYLFTMLGTLMFSDTLEQKYRINSLQENKYGFLAGITFSFFIAIFSLFLYYFGKQLGNLGENDFLYNFLSLCSISFLFSFGLRPLCRKFQHYFLLHSSSILFALVYLLFNIEVNNVLLSVIAVTLTTRLNFQINKKAFIVIMLAMCVFDMYAVWVTDIMQNMTQNYPRITPAGLLGMSFSSMKFLGAGDVIFSSLAVAFVRRNFGASKSLILIWLLIGSMFVLNITTWRPFNPNSFPCMVLISPLALMICFSCSKKDDTKM